MAPVKHLTVVQVPIEEMGAVVRGEVPLYGKRIGRTPIHFVEPSQKGSTLKIVATGQRIAGHAYNPIGESFATLPEPEVKEAPKCRGLQDLINKEGWVCPYKQARRLWVCGQKNGQTRATTKAVVIGALRHQELMGRTHHYFKSLEVATFGDHIHDHQEGGFTYGRKTAIEMVEETNKVERIHQNKKKGSSLLKKMVKEYHKLQKGFEEQELLDSLTPTGVKIEIAPRRGKTPRRGHICTFNGALTPKGVNSFEREDLSIGEEVPLPVEDVPQREFSEEEKLFFASIRLKSQMEKGVKETPKTIGFDQNLGSEFDLLYNNILTIFSEFPRVQGQGTSEFSTSSGEINEPSTSGKSKIELFKDGIGKVHEWMQGHTHTPRVDKANEIMDKLDLQTLTDISTGIDDLSTFQYARRKLADKKYHVLFFVVLAVILSLFAHDSGQVFMILALMCTLLGLEFYFDWIDLIKHYLQRLWTFCSTNTLRVRNLFENTATPQGLDDFDYAPLIGPIVGIMGTGVVYMNAQADNRTILPLYKVSQITRSMKNIKDFKQCLALSVEEADKWVFEVTQGIPAELRDDDEALQIIESWSNSVNDSILSSEWIQDLIVNPSKIDKVNEMLTEGKELFKKYKLRRDFANLVSSNIRLIEKYKFAIDSFSSQNRSRHPPLVLYISGGTNIGKTTMIQRLVIDIWSKAVPLKEKIQIELPDLIYAKPTDEFYDGYKNNFCFLWDEFLQNINIREDAVNDAIEFMGMANTHDLKLKIATCEAKNKVHFNSPLMVLTSNVKDPKPEIASVGARALLRRFDIQIDCTVQPKFLSSCNNELDNELWVSHCEKEGLDSSLPDYLIFTIKGESSSYTYSQLIDHVACKFRRKQEISTSLETQLDDHFKKARAQGITEFHSNVKKSAESSSFNYLNGSPMHVVTLLYFMELSDRQSLYDPNRFDNWLSNQNQGIKDFVSDYDKLEPQEKIELFITCNALFKYSKEQRIAILRCVVSNVKLRYPDVPFIEVSRSSYQDILDCYLLPQISIINRIKSVFEYWYTKCPLFTSIGLLSAGIAGVVLLYKTFTSFFPGIKSHSTPEAYNKQNFRRIRGRKPESAISNSFENNVRGPLENNLVTIRVYSDDLHTDRPIQRTNGIGVCDGHILVPKHLLLDKDKYANGFIEIEDYSSKTKVPFREITIKNLSRRYQYDDAVVLKLKYNCKKIIQHFVSDRQAKNIYDGLGELIVKRGKMRSFITEFFSQEKTIEEDEDFRQKVDLGAYTLTTAVGWNYDAPTQDGDCGSPLVSYGCDKVIGIHCAALSRGVGFSCIITTEMLREVISTGKPEGVRPDYISNQVEYMGSPEFTYHMPTKNPIHFSKMASKLDWKCVTYPTILHPNSFGGERVEPLVLAMNKYTDFVPDLDQEYVIRAYDFLRFKLLSFSKDPKILNNFEVINGYEDKSLCRINPASGPGYPYAIDGIKKKELLKFDGLYYEMTEDLKEEFMRFESNIENESIYWLDYLKAERIPKEKVEKGKVRIFSACPFLLTLLIRKYFGDFCAYLHRNWHKTGICVGINVHDDDWGFLARAINGHRFIYDVDIKGWDASIPKAFLYYFIRISNDYYNDSHFEIREVLGKHMFECLHVVKKPNSPGAIYRPYTGNPSGNPLTCEINSICNLMINYYLLMKYHEFTEKDLQFSLFLAAFGDDLIVSSDKEVKDYDQSYKQIGMTATNSKKTGPPCVTALENITFLKRRFVYRNGKWFAPLPIEIVKESLLWTDSSLINENDVLVQTFNAFLLECYHYPIKEVSNIIVQAVQAAYQLKLEIVFDEIIFAAIRNNPIEGINYGQRLIIWILSKVWSKVETHIVDFDFTLPLDVILGVRELGYLIPGVDRGIFQHVGFILANDPTKELTFSSNGIVVIDTVCVPCSDQFILHTLPTGGKYHSWSNNCMHWVQKTLDANKIDYDILSKFLKFSQDNYSHKLIKPQGEEPLLEVVDSSEQLVSSLTSRQDVSMSTYGQSFSTRTIEDIEQSYEIIGEFIWSTTQDIHKNLSTISIPDSLWDIPQFIQKIRYNRLLRGSIKVWLSVATTPFHQGSLYMYWIPQGGAGFPNNDSPNAHTVTALPGTWFYAATKNLCELNIPFVYDRSAYDLLAGGQLGVIKVMIINKLATSVASSVECKIFVSFDSIEVVCPTSGLPAKETPAYSPTSDIFFPKMQGEGEEKSRSGIISGITETVGSVARLVSNIPFFSGPASFVANIAETVTSVARFLGLSKPVSQEATKPVIPRPFSGVSFSDGLDMAIPLSVDPKNSVKVGGFYGSNVDELSINYPVKTPCMVNRFVWTNQEVNRQVLCSIPVTPTLSYRLSGHVSKCAITTPLGYISQCFSYWRGSLQFRLDVICTALHAGALLVTFHPGCNFVQSEKIRLTEVSSFSFVLSERTSLEFTVPYVASTPYLKVGNIFDDRSFTDETCVGTVNISVMNKLIGPSTVSSNVDVNIIISGGDDFEFALPTLQNISRFLYGVTPQTLEPHGAVDVQVEERSREQWQLGSNAPFFKEFERLSNSCLDVVMGEKVYTLKDILRISCRKYTVKLPSLHKHLFLPRHRFFTNDEIIDEIGYGPTFYDYVLRMYRYSRGSVVHRWVIDNSSSKISVSLGIFGAESLNEWVDYSYSYEGSPWVLCTPTMNPTLEYVLPFYNHKLLNVHGSIPDERQICIEYFPLDSIDDDERYMVGYESIGDDFSAGYLMPPPPLLDRDAMPDIFFFCIQEAQKKYGYHKTYGKKETEPFYNVKFSIQTMYVDRSGLSQDPAEFIQCDISTVKDRHFAANSFAVFALKDQIDVSNYRYQRESFSTVASSFVVAYIPLATKITKGYELQNEVMSQRFGGIFVHFVNLGQKKIYADFVKKDYIKNNLESILMTFIPEEYIFHKGIKSEFYRAFHLFTLLSAKLEVTEDDQVEFLEDSIEVIKDDNF
ncbi:hypothetical protein [Beihai picorna-like virus 96]|uniref:hypothetical protein n=1 Tax=Beihai picorna-like virus 96 TaxID=1922641 RepID=UPI00090B1DE1|nr:hypothetical protein [Beihai picorna-like virus 96]APG77927.1 hypothetical protein [Beihai picorna-like virus 96]